VAELLEPPGAEAIKARGATAHHAAHAPWHR
jgi:hypothetical protein